MIDGSSTIDEIGLSPAPGGVPSAIVRRAMSPSSTEQELTSCQSWSSDSIQKTATDGTPCWPVARSASFSAVMALNSVNSGPPNNPACWPVTTATVAASARRPAASFASAGAPRRSCCARSTSTSTGRFRGRVRACAIASDQAPGCAGSPAKNRDSLGKSNA
jgi:hypothetical protein